MNTPVVCPECAAPVPVEFFQGLRFGPCLGCNTPLLARAFPALLRQAPQGISGERITEAGQAACFYHPGKTAHVPCDACGRFICALCDVELHGQHLCPSCVESRQRKGTLTTFESRRVLWDNIALSVAVLPVATVFLAGFSMVTAPAAILLAVFGWRRPGSLAPRSKIRFVLAIVFSLLEIAAWVAFFYFISVSGEVFQ
ncbi:MAG TPA: B-box zinc finger protein [Methylomirabilota bacterium]|nr:B-box zinc finger protein [Methylomirabilota bacterium]